MGKLTHQLTDRLTYYRNTVVRLLQDYYALKPRLNSTDTVKEYLVLDKESDNYLWIRSGWKGTQRVQYIIFHLRIEQDKIWVEEDSTDLCIVDDLLQADIPKEDIVLGFHHPNKRKLTEFATGNDTERERAS
ncbi:XisI protein [Spirulina sp. 06S082]|uniref:XisI protein n=1 Tax=Spirulina sp. 06S082 TaxID=3110248 RepID=UPI002B21E4F8|nr:XisI protein [Spirulina sp. 06S082]MEA5468635.1 XisI protein [Spirulina sp. 06S082]